MLNTARFIPEKIADWEMQMPIPSQMGSIFNTTIYTFPSFELNAGAESRASNASAPIFPPAATGPAHGRFAFLRRV
jgi:hypothetical protein